MRQRSVSTADNGASYKDNGIGLSLAKQQSTDDRGGEETATTVQRPMGDGGGEIQQSALILGGGGRWSGLDRVLRLGGEGLSRGTGGVFAGGEGTRELIVKKIHRPRCESGGLRYNGKNGIYSHAKTSGARRGAFFDFHTPPCAEFRTFLSAIDFGAPLAHSARLPSFSNFKLVCPLCPPRLHHASTAPAPHPRPTPTAHKFDRLKSL
jgi:hypothetical protein